MPLIAGRIVSFPDVIPFEEQGVEVTGTKCPGQSGHYRNAIWGLIDENTPNCLLTLDSIFEDAVRFGKDNVFLGHRPIVCRNPLKFADKFSWLTYGDADLMRRYVGSGLHKLFKDGILGGYEYETVGIWSANRPEWQLLDIALQSYDKVSVSLYDTLGMDAVEYIIKHAQISAIFTTQDHVPELFKIKQATPCLKMVVVIDDVTLDTLDALEAWASTIHVKLMQWSKLEAFGKKNMIEPIRAFPDTVATICYTSGTTATPKGVVLKHKNLALSVKSNMYGAGKFDKVVLLSYLPLAHIYERVCEIWTIALGGSIGYSTGDPLRLLEDAQILKPTFFPTVPRVLNRVYQAAMAGGNVPGLKGKLFQNALNTKLERLHNTGQLTHMLWDRLVFQKIHAVLGGNIQKSSCGSAPISPDVLDFIKISLACDVVEGYGLTETCATCTVSWCGDRSASGTVGPPQPVCEVKVMDVPDMNYTAEDKPYPRGELCIRGANCFTEYYKNEKNTSETVDSEGWVHTGDIAEIDCYGRVRIIDRIKNIMKLAQGEYVALEKIENMYGGSQLVAQLFVHGDGLQSYLVAVLVPDPVQFSIVVSSVTGVRVMPDDMAALQRACHDERIVEHALATLTKEALKKGLKGFEMIKRLHLSMKSFSVENNTMTPTLKIKRKNAYLMYKSELDLLYLLGEPVKL